MKTRLIKLLQPFSRRIGPVLGLALCLWGNARAATTLDVVEPLDYQVIQRTTRDRGIIPVVTRVNADGKTPDVVEVRWVGESGAGVWQPLRLRGGTRAELALDAPSGGWFRLEVRARDAGAVVANAVVEHVGVGEVLVVAGQSNSANHGEEKLTTQTRLVATFDGKRWGLSRDPQPGASGGDGSFLPALGDQLAVRWKVPVGFVATGVGATSVREWLPADQVFPNPPTLTGNVRAVPAGGWQSTGELYRRLVARMESLGPRGFRAVLWHQGESDANQRDTTRTLPGSLYREQLQTVIQRSRRDVGWDVPWFVALVSYHTPDDTGSEDIRSAQRALWESGIALPGPDSDALVGDLRDGGGKGVHFSGKGLRVHAARWAEKVGPWVDGLPGMGGSTSGSKPKSSGAPGRLVLPGDSFEIQGRPAFVFLPSESKRRQPQPWIFYAPTLPPYPDEAERWMHEQFLDAGIAVAGVDVGEAYGNPGSHAVFDALYKELTTHRGFARRAALFGRSRGGLWVSSWAIAHPERVAGIIGIYPVYDFKTYPGLEKAAPAYGLSAAELAQRAGELNPIERISTLAKAGIPIALIHGDADAVVPLGPNSQRVVDQYAAAGAKGLTQLIVLPGQGHSFYEPYFHSTPLVEFAIRQAREGAR